MAIRFLDEGAAPAALAPKGRIRFLDEEPTAPTTATAAPAAPESFLGRLTRGVKESGMAPVAPWLALSKDKAQQDLGQRAMDPKVGMVGLPQMMQGIGDKARASGLVASQRIGEGIAEGPLSKVSPGLAAGLGAAVGTAADIATHGAILSPQDAQQAIGAEAIGPALKIGKGAAAKASSAVAEAAGRRSMGFIKSIIKKLRGGAARADEVAQAMLDKGVVSGFGGAQEMLDRAQSIADDAGTRMGTHLSELDAKGVPAFETADLAQRITKELSPGSTGGIADRLHSEVKKIVETVQGFGDGPLPFAKAQELKKLVDPGKWSEQQVAAMGEEAQKVFKIRQRATGLIENAIERGVKSGGGDMAAYKLAKRDYGLAADAKKGLQDLVNKDSGNKFIDPFTAAAGIGGGIMSMANQSMETMAATLAAIGAQKFSQKFGAQLTAKVADFAAKSIRSPGMKVGPRMAGAANLGIKSITQLMKEQNQRRK